MAGAGAGYAYGGSLYARTQVKNIQLISMTLPDINAGCGGIDAYLARSVLLMAISCSVLLSRL
ncbi:conjugal transfer protein TraH [Escherichia coli]|uniref:conjugal transfer protein TraH n=1 Tax=Escherichia coli TaxID=562 RepID=UPI003B585EF3